LPVVSEPGTEERPPILPVDPRPPTSLSRRFVRYLVGFGVGVTLGLAPFLGTVGVPGFVPLVDLLPLNLQERVAALAPIVMGVLAVVVQFGSAVRTSQRRLRRRFAITLAVLGGGFVLLVVLQALLVQEVDILGGEKTVRYAVWLNRPDTCDCPPRLSHRECIAQLSLDPARVETCWGTGPTRMSELALTLGYLLVIGGFGGLVGLLLLQEEARRRRR
jgi:hypothetical protein